MTDDWAPVSSAKDDWAPVNAGGDTGEPTMFDRLRANPVLGAPFQGAVRTGQGVEQLAAHGAANLSDLFSSGEGTKGAGTGKPASHSISSMLHAIADDVDRAASDQNRAYEEAGARVDKASTMPGVSSALRKTGEFVGSAATPLGKVGELVPAARAAGPVLTGLMRGGATGAAFGASQPVLNKEAENYWLAKAEQTGTGAALGGLLGAAGEATTRTAAPVPTSRMFKNLASDAYDDAHASGATVPKSEFEKAIHDAEQGARADVSYRPTLQPRATAALDAVRQDLSVLPPEMTFKDMDVARRVMRTVLNSPDANERAVAHQVIDGIDDYVNGLNVPEGSALGQARSYFSRGAKLEAVERAMDKAQNATGSGGFIPAGANQSRTKFDNAVRQQFAKILNNPRAARQFNADEREAMKTIVNGTTTQNIARLAGKASPTQAIPLVSELLSVSGALAAGEPLAAAGAAGLGVTGAVGQGIADTISQGNVDALKNVIATGSRRRAQGPSGVPSTLVTSSPMPHVPASPALSGMRGLINRLID